MRGSAVISLIMLFVLGCSSSAAVSDEAASQPAEESLIPTEFDTYWLILLRATQNPVVLTPDQQRENQLAHLRHLRTLVLSGRALVVGPLQTPREEPLRGVIIAPSSLTREEVETMMREDPHVAAGVLEPLILPWMTNKGSVQWPSEPVW